MSHCSLIFVVPRPRIAASGNTVVIACCSRVILHCDYIVTVTDDVREQVPVQFGHVAIAEKSEGTFHAPRDHVTHACATNRCIGHSLVCEYA